MTSQHRKIFADSPHPQQPARRRTIGQLAALGLAAATPQLPKAQTVGSDAWPSRPVRFLLGFAPGGATDILSRLYCDKMSTLSGAQFVVENRTGAGGLVAMTALSKSASDGYTVGMGNISNNATARALYARLPYEPEKDFIFASGLWKLPNLLVINPKIEARTVAELINLVKASPGKFTFASSGPGTTVHLSGELFKSMAGLDMRHVPYRGGRPALMDLIAGHVDMLFDNIPGSIQFAKNGAVRALAVTTAQRDPSVPDIPAMAEFLPGFELTSWTALTAPAGVPPAIIEKMSALSASVLNSPDIVQRFRDLGAAPWPTSPAEVTTYRAQEEARLTPIIRNAGIKLE